MEEKFKREILILDDDIDFCNYASLHLRGKSIDFEQFDVRVFTDPYDFMRAIRSPDHNQRIVLVVLDYLLEGYIHGLMVAERLGKDYPDIAQVICTSHTNQKVFRKICASGSCARSFVEKPLNNGKELRQIVEETLNQRDEFFSRFEFKEEPSPFVVPQIPRSQVIWDRRRRGDGSKSTARADGNDLGSIEPPENGDTEGDET